MNIKTISAAVALSLFSFVATAATETTTLNVTATVTESCDVGTTPLAFGDYNPVDALAVTGQGTVSVTCTNGTAYEIGLDAGSGAAATVSTRSMSETVNGSLNYDLYTDVGLSTNWGNTPGTDTYSDPLLTLGSGESQVHQIYGQIDAGQATAPKGTYTDTVNVTVSYAL